MTAGAWGIAAAIVTLLAWGIGDFSIQRSIRRGGSLPTLLIIGIMAALFLLPLAWPHLSTLTVGGVFGLLGISVWATAITIINFEALRRGKISVIEPILSIELLVTVLIGTTVLREHLSWGQWGMIGAILLGVILTVTRRQPSHWWSRWLRFQRFESGIWLAIMTAIGLAFINVTIGRSSQSVHPVLTIWVVHSGLAVFSFLWMLVRDHWHELRDVFRPANRNQALLAGIFDNLGWVGFATATSLIPISLVTPITEGYVAIAAILGITVSREQLQPLQKLGIGVTLLSVIGLSVTISV